jgi:DNA-binding NarL/FixJ family response regulator
VRRRAGRLRDAEADARAALGVAVAPGIVPFIPAVAPLVGALLDQGHVQHAALELDRVPPVESLPQLPPMIAVLLARMALRAARHDLTGALADWDTALARSSRTGGLKAPWIDDLCVVAATQRAAGDLEAATDTAATALELARGWDTPGAIGQALAAQAQLVSSHDAVEILGEAVALLGSSPARLEHARALVSLGGALRRQGHRVDSREPLREGFELAAACGAETLAELARTELRASGIRLRREAATGADGLTPSERRIAHMAAAGLSNPQIVQELFLTVKTVEMHLTQSYRKLGIGRRTELADALTAKT